VTITPLKLSKEGTNNSFLEQKNAPAFDARAKSIEGQEQGAGERV
jgi:hypothetical protein